MHAASQDGNITQHPPLSAFVDMSAGNSTRSIGAWSVGPIVSARSQAQVTFIEVGDGDVAGGLLRQGEPEPVANGLTLAEMERQTQEEPILAQVSR